MKTLNEVETALKGQMPLMQEHFKVEQMGIIGTLARGEENESGGVDILVHFSEPVGAARYLKLENYLSCLLGLDVNLVLRMGLSYKIARQVLKEALYIW